MKLIIVGKLLYMHIYCDHFFFFFLYFFISLVLKRKAVIVLEQCSDTRHIFDFNLLTEIFFFHDKCYQVEIFCNSS